jgi:hypothetical protein
MTMLAVAAMLGVAACGSSPNDDSTASTSPETKIQTFTHAGISLPRTKADGPETTDPFPRGYAHTPTGAALAAVNTTIVLDTAADGDWGQALAALVVNDKAYQQWAVARQQVSITAASSSAAKVTIAGFRVGSYAGDTATIEVFSTYPDGSHTKLVRTVRWSGTDWKVVLPSDDSSSVVSSVTDFPDGMVAL